MFLLVLIAKTFATTKNDENESILSKRKKAFLVVGAATAAASGIGYVHMPFSKSPLLIPTELAMFKAISSIYDTNIPSSYIESFIKWSGGSGIIYCLIQGVVKLNFVPSSVKNHIFIPKEVFSTYLSGNMKYIGHLNNGYLEYIQDMYYENAVKFSALLGDMLSGIRINFDWIKLKSIGKSFFNCFGIFDGGVKSAATAGISTATLGTAYIYLIEKIYNEQIDINSMSQDEFTKYYEDSFK